MCCIELTDIILFPVLEDKPFEYIALQSFENEKLPVEYSSKDLIITMRKNEDDENYFEVK